MLRAGTSAALRAGTGAALRAGTDAALRAGTGTTEAREGTQSSAQRAGAVGPVRHTGLRNFQRRWLLQELHRGAWGAGVGEA